MSIKALKAHFWGVCEADRYLNGICSLVVKDILDKKVRTLSGVFTPTRFPMMQREFSLCLLPPGGQPWPCLRCECGFILPVVLRPL